MNMELSFEQILTLINTVAEKDLGEFLLEQGDTRLKIEGRKLPKTKTTQNVLPQIPIPMAVEGLGTAESAQMGSQVKAGDVLFIVESMKLMNEVQSEFSGTVEEILVQNGQPVEYGQPIMRIV